MPQQPQYVRPQPVGEVFPDIESDFSDLYLTAVEPPEFPPDPNVQIIITGVGTYQGLEVTNDYAFRSIVNVTHTGVGGTALYTTGDTALVTKGDTSLGDGTITIGRAGTDDVSVLGEFISDLIPNATATYDIGSSSRRWADLFVVKTTTDSLLVDNNAYVGAALTVVGNSTFQKWIDVTGTIGASNVNVTGVVTATQFNGPATQIQTISDATNAARYVTFVDSNNGTSTGENLYTDAGITYNPSSNALTATTFVGNLQGNADTATSATSSGSSTNADNVPVTSTADATTWPMLVGDTAGYQAPLYDTNLTYNASTNTLTAGFFSGDGSGLTGVTAGSSTNADNVYIDESEDDNVNYNVVFMDQSGGGNLYRGLQVDDGGLAFNPNTNTLTCNNITGTASNASAVNTVSTATNASFYPTFVNSNNGTAASETIFTDAGIIYNPSNNVLSTIGVIASGGFKSDSGAYIKITTSGSVVTFTVDGVGSGTVTLA